MLIRPIRGLRTGWLTGTLHVLILWVAAEADTPSAWPYALGAMSIVSFLAWAANYRRYRVVHDVPTSRVASAAQGYTELYGEAANIPDSPVTAPLSNLPCCWYRYRVEQRDDRKWRHVDSGESVAHFLLVDESGQCVISPDGAEVYYARDSRWTTDDMRYTEELILPGTELYALGEFRTTGGAHYELNENRDMSQLLADWKKDHGTLLERFDSDKSGALDLAEWERARLEAQREVRNQHAAIRAQDGVHLLSKPENGRVFILAGCLPEKIGRRYLRWSLAHLVFMFAAGIGALLMASGS